MVLSEVIASDIYELVVELMKILLVGYCFVLHLVNLIEVLWIVSELIIILIKNWLDEVAKLDLHTLRYNVAEVGLILAALKIVHLPHILEVCRF